MKDKIKATIYGISISAIMLLGMYLYKSNMPDFNRNQFTLVAISSILISPFVVYYGCRED